MCNRTESLLSEVSENNAESVNTSMQCSHLMPSTCTHGVGGYSHLPQTEAQDPQHKHRHTLTDTQSQQRNGLVLLKALEEKRFPRAQAIRETHRSPVSWACAPSVSPLPCVQVTGAIIFLPSSKQRNQGLGRCRQLTWDRELPGLQGARQEV